MFGFRKRRRRKIAQKPFPSEWLGFLRRNVRYFHLLGPEDQIRLMQMVQIFMDEKRFEGCGGLEVSTEIRVTLSAMACIPLLGGTSDFYPRLVSIVVYPGTYLARIREQQPDGIVWEGTEPRLGESWTSGAMVLSWEDVLQDAADPCDGHNVVYHECAHQLDSESDLGEGAPNLPDLAMYSEWNRVFSREYEALSKLAAAGRPSLLDPYGATSPAEFFAVATEYFFEIPSKLRARHSALYEQLQCFYRQDPAALFQRRYQTDRSVESSCHPFDK